jgi:glucose-6-phosphate isomerase
MLIDPRTSLIEPFGLQCDLLEGVIDSSENPIVRRASDMRGYYADEAALERLISLEGDPVHYEVFEGPVPEEYGQIRFCISKLYPGVVGDECFMTKGHYHATVATGELYLCLKGRGLLVLKLADGTCRTEELVRGRLVYVPPYWAHRSINTGSDPLISLCIYPGDAGHNYGDIKKAGFPCRVFRKNGRIVIEDYKT